MRTFGKSFGLVVASKSPILSLNLPVNLVSAFTVDTILGQLNWTDTNAGAAQYEVYSATNGAAEVLLGTTITGATSYQDTTCKQNASVVYRIRAKKGTNVTDFVSAPTLLTPLCWKTNQSVLTQVLIFNLDISVGKSVILNWGDGTSQDYSGVNSGITKNYSATGQYNIWLTGDTDNINSFLHYSQQKTIGDITNWVLPSSLINFSVDSTGLTGNVTNWILPSTLISFKISTTALTGDVTNWILPSTLINFYINSTGLTGNVTNWILTNNLGDFDISLTALTGDVTNWILQSKLIRFYINSTTITGSLPQITAHATYGLNLRAQLCYISDANVTVFRKAMTAYNIGSQNVAFPTANIDKLLKAAADWYQVNAPTANCTYTLSGANMGIPTGGVSNADLTRLVGYYTAAGRSCTILVKTS